MPSEISAFIPSQTQTQTQTQTLQISNASSDTDSSQPGQFATLMSEYISPEDNTTEQITSNNTQNNIQELITFTGSNSFSQPVIDILAGFNDAQKDSVKDSVKDSEGEINGIISKLKSLVSEKTELPDDIDGLISQVLNDETIPEDTKHEIMNEIKELVNLLKDSDDDYAKDIALKLSYISDSSDIHDDSDDTESEGVNDVNDDDDVNNVSDFSVSIAGSSMIQNSDSVQADTVIKSEIESESESQPEITDMNNQPQTLPRKSDIKPQNESESRNENVKAQQQPHESSHESRYETNNENITSKQDSQPQTQTNSNNSSGQNENPSEHEHEESSTATRNASRKLSSSRTQNVRTERTERNERTETNSRRTESHNTFQSFFEGVLSTRRNASRTSAMPLNLQTGTYALNQAQTLRDGMINVVRFIRADGVQKANVVVDPPALGRISVELSSTSSGVEASIKVASEQIRQLVQDQLSELRMNLSQQGVQVAEFTVDVQQDNSQNGNHQGGQYSNEQRAFAINEADDDTEEFRIDLEEGLLYWVA